MDKTFSVIRHKANGNGAQSKSAWKSLFQFRGEISRNAYLFFATLSLILFAIGWYLITSWEVFPPEFFPSPRGVLSAMSTMLSSQEFYQDVLASAGRIAAAFFISSALAIPVGLLMSSFKWIEALVEPLVDFIMYVPVPALIPLFIIWTGIGEGSKFLVLFFGTFFQMVLLIMDDADNVPRAYFDLARTMGASTLQLIRDVLIPYLMPQIYDRLRVTLGWCWTYLIIAELIAVERGIGHTIKEAQRFNASDQMFVCFIVLGIIGLLTDYTAKVAYSRLYPYATKVTR
jgi:NitT/TauT family transport system permease protein